MDPNAALKEIRELVENLQDCPLARQGIGATLDDMDSLVALVDSLDQWLSKAGFLPDAWQVKETNT